MFNHVSGGGVHRWHQCQCRKMPMTTTHNGQSMIVQGSLVDKPNEPKSVDFQINVYTCPFSPFCYEGNVPNLALTWHLTSSSWITVLAFQSCDAMSVFSLSIWKHLTCGLLTLCTIASSFSSCEIDSWTLSLTWNETLIHCSGGSRISRRRGVHPLGGTWTSNMGAFWWKWMQKWKNWVPWGACASHAPPPPRSANVLIWK